MCVCLSVCRSVGGLEAGMGEGGRGDVVSSA